LPEGSAEKIAGGWFWLVTPATIQAGGLIFRHIH
jgi:hypothetical protein